VERVTGYATLLCTHTGSGRTDEGYACARNREHHVLDIDRDLIEAALHGYELGPEIGRGGWGVVYRARHESLDRHVAVKVLPRAFSSDEVTRERFIDEARLGAQLDHPHIVKVYDFIEHEGLWLIIMERLGGGTLWDRFIAQGLHADEVCAIGLGLSAALEAAHGRGIIHRDIKPENLLFTDEGTPRLADFGVAKALNLGFQRTAQGEVLGTPAYMSPEQARGKTLGATADVYGSGVLLYETLSGRLPFLEVDDPMAMLLMHIEQTPSPIREIVPDLPQGVADVVMKCLAKDPSERYATGGEMGVALAEAASAAYGPGWLRHSGVEIRAWGPIAEAATRAPASKVSVRAPSLALPAVRTHTRVGTHIESPSVGSRDVGGFGDQPHAETRPARATEGAPGATVAPRSRPSTADDKPVDNETAASEAADSVDDSPLIDESPRPLTLSGPNTAIADASGNKRNVFIGVGVLVAALVAGIVLFVLPSGDPEISAESTTTSIEVEASTSTSVGTPSELLADSSLMALAETYAARCRRDGGEASECLCQLLVLADEGPGAGVETPLENLVADYSTTGALPAEAESLLEGRCQG